MDEKIKLIEELISKVDIRKFPRLIYFYHGGSLFFDRGVIISSYFLGDKNGNHDNKLILHDSVDRKEILDALIQIEFLLFELVINHLKISRDRTYEFIELVENLSIRNLAKSVKNWKLIEQSEFNIIEKLINVRNKFAHSLAPGFIDYKNISIREDKGKDLLIEDINKIYKQLIKKIEKLQPKPDELIIELQNLQVKSK